EKQTLSPLDLERRFGLTGGNIFHGEMGLDQMFVMRPVAGYARYRTPIRGLYLCGSGAHPGGGVMGAPGHNAAREILKDRCVALCPCACCQLATLRFTPHFWPFTQRIFCARRESSPRCGSPRRAKAP